MSTNNSKEEYSLEDLTAALGKLERGTRDTDDDISDNDESNGDNKSLGTPNHYSFMVTLLSLHFTLKTRGRR